MAECKEATVTIEVDCREPRLAELLGAACIVRQLDVGDVRLFTTGGKFDRVVVVEMETVQDLRASVVDGRYEEQCARLTALEKKNGGTADAVFIILHGPLDYSHAHARVDVVSVVISLLCRRHIPVFRTADVAETACFLRAAAEWAVRNAKKPDVDPSDRVESYRRSGCLAGAVLHSVKKKNLFEPRALWVAQLQCVPGVSANMAVTIAERFRCAAELSAAISADRKACARSISDVEVSSTSKSEKKRRVGAVVAGRIIAALVGRR